MKNVVKKPNRVFPNVTSKIQTKSIQLMVCALNNCFCCQKAKMIFTQSNFKNMDKQQSAHGVRAKQLNQSWKRTFSTSGALSETLSTYRKINHYFFCLLPYTWLSFACRCHETSLIPFLLLIYSSFSTNTNGYKYYATICICFNKTRLCFGQVPIKINKY